MPTSYTVKSLIFGTAATEVPGHQPLEMKNVPVPTLSQIAAEDAIWDLVFIQRGGQLYGADAVVVAAAHDVIECWYQKRGSGGGIDHSLTLLPFVVDDDGTGSFVTDDVVDFSQPSPWPNSISTDTISAPSVTATVHTSIAPEGRVELHIHSFSHHAVLELVTYEITFDHIHVYNGAAAPTGNTLVVPKATSVHGLAVFRRHKVVNTRDVRTDQKSKIPKREWGVRLAEAVLATLDGSRGDWPAYLTAAEISHLDASAKQEAIAAVERQIAVLTNVKRQVGGH